MGFNSGFKGLRKKYIFDQKQRNEKDGRRSLWREIKMIK